MACTSHIPVLLVHGIASRDESTSGSKLWGRIPDALRAAGHPVFFGDQDAWGTVETNAEQLAKTIESVAAQSPDGQVVIVAHSKGGLDSLAACRLPGIAEKVRALITLSSPHQGMAFCDWLLRSRVIIPRIAAPVVNAKAKLSGDANPDSYGALQALGARSRGDAEGEPRSETVPLISVGFEAPQPKGLVGSIVQKLDGPNDGLVPLSATNAGNWKVARILDGTPFLHTDCLDDRTRNIPLELDGTHHNSIADLIRHLVSAAAEVNR